MSTLFGNNISQTYQGLIKLADSTTGVTATTQSLQDGLGNNIPIQVSNTTVNISGSFLVNGQPVSIETGSFATTGSNTFIGNQTITGSLTVFSGNTTLDNTIISGSLIGNTVNGGLIKIQNEANRSGSVQFNITGSNPVSQSNVIFGNPVGAASVTQTGSVILSGSNNIILNGFRTDSSTFGTYGYINGNGNIGNTIPTLGTGSLLRPTMNQNALQSFLNLQFTTSSLGQGNIQSNLIYGGVTINHQSGSVNYSNNHTLGGGVISNQNITTANTTATISNNLFTSNLNTNLNHNSSSIIYQGNIGAVVVNNNYSSSVSTAVDNINVNQNLFNGNSETITVSGSNSGTRRTFNSNLISGRSNLVNSNHSGSSFTGGHLVATTILGQELIVSASHTSPSQGGSTFVGRYNATGSLQESSQDAVFVVGTGAGVGNRRNALHIDSNNNTRITGSVTISGSLSVNGSSVVTGSVVTDRNGLITTGSIAQTQSITGSLLVSGSSTITGSVNISGSLQVTNKINNLKIWTGSLNTNSIGIGDNTLNSQTGSSLNNIAIGGGALATNITGANVVAIGNGALGNSVAGFNTAVGAAALGANTTGENNIAIGQSAFQANTIGVKNTAIGWNSGVNNITGSTNTIIGAQALQENISGSGNVAIGYGAGYYSTGSNGFYVGNDNYGGLNTEQEKSMMYGEFNNTTNNQSLRINAKTNITNNLVVTGSITVTGGITGSIDKTGLITTGSNTTNQSITGSIDIIGNFPGDPGKTFVIRSGSMKMGDFNNSVRIADLNNQPQLFFNGTRKVGFFLGQSNMDQVDTQFGIVSGSENIYTMGGNFNNFRSGSYNLMLGVLNIQIKSGSNNIILAKQTSYTTGSNNLILGSLQGVDEAQDYFNLQLPQSNDPIMFKSGSAPLTISGSLKVTDGANITGSLRVSGDVMFASGSNKTMGTVVLDGGNPGVATVSNSLVTSNSLIFLTKQTNTNSGNGTVSVTSKGGGTFSITSNHNGDTDVVAYQIINPV